MKTSMDLERAIDACRDGLKASFKMEVIPCTYNPNEYNVFADGIQIIPTEQATQTRSPYYTALWGRNLDGKYYFRLSNSDVVCEVSSSALFDYDTLDSTERQFCEDAGVPFSGLMASASWAPFTNATPVFTKIKDNRPAPDLSDPEQCGLRLCHFGCGRMLRSHEKFCTDCVGDGDSLYSKMGGW